MHGALSFFCAMDFNSRKTLPTSPNSHTQRVSMSLFNTASYASLKSAPLLKVTGFFRKTLSIVDTVMNRLQPMRTAQYLSLVQSPSFPSSSTFVSSNAPSSSSFAFKCHRNPLPFVSAKCRTHEVCCSWDWRGNRTYILFGSRLIDESYVKSTDKSVGWETNKDRGCSPLACCER